MIDFILKFRFTNLISNPKLCFTLYLGSSNTWSYKRRTVLRLERFEFFVQYPILGTYFNLNLLASRAVVFSESKRVVHSDARRHPSRP